VIADRVRTFLRWSERYTKTDMLYAVRGGFWLALGQAFTSLSLSLVAIIFANTLSKTTFGTYNYVLSVAGLLSIATLPQMGVALTQAVARGYEGSIHRAVRAKLRYGPLGTIPCLGLAAWRGVQGDTEQAAAFVLLAILLPFLDAFAVYDAFLGGRKLFDVSVRYGVLFRVASTLVLIVAALSTKNLLLILVAYFAPRPPLHWLLYRATLKHYPPNRHEDDGVVAYGTHLSVVGIIPTIATYLDRLLVFHILGPAQLAVYAIAIAAPEQLKNFLSILDLIGLPKFARRPAREIQRSMRAKYLLLLLVALVVIGGYVLLAPLLFRWFFPAYLEAVSYSRLYALSMFNIVLVPARMFLLAKRRITEMYWSTTVTSVLQIALMVVLTLSHGLLGLILARLITRFAGVVMDWLFYRRSLATLVDTDEEPAAPSVPG
jgi:O-antigen/teichoic acid export membrane protein